MKIPRQGSESLWKITIHDFHPLFNIEIDAFQNLGLAGADTVAFRDVLEGKK
jgi:hypothetical protein